MKVGDLVKIRGRSNKDYGLVIKANKKVRCIL
jgi:hypothetical protein